MTLDLLFIFIYFFTSPLSVSHIHSSFHCQHTHFRNTFSVFGTDLNHNKREPCVKLGASSFLCSSPRPSGPQLSFLLPTTSFPAPLHPACVCMNIDVNYLLPQNHCSIYDFLEESAPNTRAYVHTCKVGYRKNECLLHSLTTAETSGVISVEVQLFNA